MIGYILISLHAYNNNSNYGTFSFPIQIHLNLMTSYRLYLLRLVPIFEVLHYVINYSENLLMTSELKN
ncbi:hypothetical protein Avbf_07401 [Armadillidium vulgare]|nr:hypothetical protein Avbf_07401 [Armadillidium vulgare]